MGYEEHNLCVRGLTLLIANLGSVEAERFISIMNREAGDYTEWRHKHLYVDETVQSLAKRARQTGEMLRDKDKVGV